MGIKEQSIKLILLKYLISTGLGLVISISLAYTFFHFLFYFDFIIPANETENWIRKKVERMEKGASFGEKFLPKNTCYLLLSKDGKKIRTNMMEEEEAVAFRFYKEKMLYASSNDGLMEIRRKNEVLILHYFLEPHYANEWMERNLPSVNILLSFLTFILCLISSFLVTLLWAKRLRKELREVFLVSKKIEGRELDFEIEYGGVKEFNTIIKGLSDMKKALGETLLKQWKLEEEKRKQIAALTHDLKTPVTIVDGNARLLQETELSEEQKEYVKYILKNSCRISNYTKALIEMNQRESLQEYQPEKMDGIELSRQVEGFAGELFLEKNISLKIKNVTKSCDLMVDIVLLERAIQNLLRNAISYSRPQSEIELAMKIEEGAFEIRVKDEGEGFSKEELLHGKEAFFRGDKSRHSSENYGLGLYSVNQIAELHGGVLILSNRKEKRGAEVVFSLPLIKEESFSLDNEDNVGKDGEWNKFSIKDEKLGKNEKIERRGFMSLEMLMIFLYLIYVMIVNVIEDFPIFHLIPSLIDLPLMGQSLILGLIFFVLERRSFFVNKKKIFVRIFFLGTGFFIGVLNSITMVSFQNRMFVFWLFSFLPVFYCSLITLCFRIVGKEK